MEVTVDVLHVVTHLSQVYGPQSTLCSLLHSFPNVQHPHCTIFVDHTFPSVSLGLMSTDIIEFMTVQCTVVILEYDQYAMY